MVLQSALAAAVADPRCDLVDVLRISRNEMPAGTGVEPIAERLQHLRRIVLWVDGDRDEENVAPNCKRRGDDRRSPIVVEIAAREGYGRGFRPQPDVLRDFPYSYRVRRSRGAKLQVAASGGRIDARHSLRPMTYGTIGGFLFDDFTGRMFGVTAAHVCDKTTGYARPVPMSRAHADPQRREIDG